MTATRPTVGDHFQRLLRLLDVEAEAEKQEALRGMQRRSSQGAEASGAALVDLVIREQDAGLGGRVLLTLGKRSLNAPLPWTRLRTGTPVILSEGGEGAAAHGWRGIVSRLRPDSIQIAFAEWPEFASDRAALRVDRWPDETARQRQRQALQRISSAEADSRMGQLRGVLLGHQTPAFHPTPDLSPLDTALNPSQREAVQFALSAGEVAVIHGPPGTGKTTTLVELIRQIVLAGQSVLAVAPSNLGVDNLLEKLVATGELFFLGANALPGKGVIRLGHPARVLPEMREHTLDELVESHPDVRLAHKWIREAYALRDQASRFTRARPERGARQAMRQEARQMIKEARQLEDQVTERLLDASRVVCATTTGLDRDLLGGRVFDWCIIDEASQSTEPGAWIPLQYARRVVLAGDPFQLPPTVLSAEAAAQGFNISLLERLMRLLGPGISRRLQVQYRMNQEIMAFSSAEFYEGSLTAHPSVRQHLLKDLPGVAENELTSTAVHFIDTAGASYDEEVEPEGESRLNPLEAAQVVQKVQALLEAGLSPADIAVISPYSAQVRLLREQIRQPEMEVDSVDGFQGREKEAVVVSLVRSNRDQEIGFLEDVRRMNVALTRARRKLIVIGDSATITAHPFYQRMVTYFEEIGAYHSVWEG